ncbi:cupin domain-containing protein [Planctomonas psychrotolerans]|uniref:cupin domain-containing protein n=1 Tax=Planctomonas psychrotolerans TaxID=2528712 RepID=UPI00123B6779|nr:cupin domain-containing protein [Planctomonas psychrotolerans]
MSTTDKGPEPHVVNIEEASLVNENYRTVIWTGSNLQVTVMAIKGGDDIGLEVHENIDQFLRIEGGRGKVQMGPAEDNLIHEWEAGDGEAIMVPAGTWHNVTAIGDETLKLYSIYSPPEHDHGIVQVTKADPE